MSHSTSKGKPQKPAKPYPDFPLFPHATKRWAKKIRGKTHYFGPWGDPEGALQKYLDQRDDLHAGRTPRDPEGALTVRDLCNRFLTSKQQQAEGGEIALRTFRGYLSSCKRIIDAFGKNRPIDDLRASDFALLRKTMSGLAPASIKLEVRKVRGVFNYGFATDLIDRPVKFGPEFRGPSQRVLTKARRQNGSKMFSPAELQLILDAATPQLRAMVLLGTNCGYGNNDCATLPQAALDLEGGWVDHPRPKTGVERRCALWPETIAALREAIATRPEPKGPADADLVFVTCRGNRWVRVTRKGGDIAKAGWQDSVVAMMDKLLGKLGLRQTGRGFYALRHTFEAIGGESIDQVAVDHIMGLSRNDMASVYRERISDERLRAVTDHVRRWLFEAVEPKEVSQ